MYATVFPPLGLEIKIPSEVVRNLFSPSPEVIQQLKMNFYFWKSPAKLLYIGIGAFKDKLKVISSSSTVLEHFGVITPLATRGTRVSATHTD